MRGDKKILIASSIEGGSTTPLHAPQKKGNFFFEIRKCLMLYFVLKRAGSSSEVGGVDTELRELNRSTVNLFKSFLLGLSFFFSFRPNPEFSEKDSITKDWLQDSVVI